jgi:2-polyprenyl-6-methoxyphenol hydroxylase-like FAD-dependent oxidoreductase
LAGRVVIVGAGPAGAALALEFSRAGIATTLVEASRRFERRFRGEALMPSGLEALTAMGLDPLLAALPQRPLRGWRVLVNGQELFSVAEPPACCTLVNQPALLQALVQAAQQHQPFRWIQGLAAGELLEGGGRIAGVRLADGERLEADLVVACDGRDSPLRHRAGLELVEQPQPIDLLWLQLSGEEEPPLQGDFLTALGDQGLFSAFASVGGALQIGWVIEAGARVPPFEPQAWIGRLAAQSPAPLAHWLRHWGDRLEAPSRLAVRSGLVRQWWRPGLLLLGDAAHPMSPVRAQGINMALRDAWLAARLLTPALQAGATAPQIDALLPQVAAGREPEVTLLQHLQQQETRRGNLLRRQPVVRQLLAASAPWLGPAIGHHWQQQQRLLRLGSAMMAG